MPEFSAFFALKAILSDRVTDCDVWVVMQETLEHREALKPAIQRLQKLEALVQVNYFSIQTSYPLPSPPPTTQAYGSNIPKIY